MQAEVPAMSLRMQHLACQWTGKFSRSTNSANDISADPLSYYSSPLCSIAHCAPTWTSSVVGEIPRWAGGEWSMRLTRIRVVLR